MSFFSPWDLPLPYASNHSNLQCFLQCITPVVPTRLLPKKCIQTSDGFLRTLEKDIVEGFTLSDLWHSYTEWGAYGAAVPIVLNNGDRVVQYYSPSLSALQIYTTKPFSSSRGLGNMAKPENGSCCNDHSGRDKIYGSSSSSNGSCLSSNATWDNDSTTFQFGSCAQTIDQCGYLYYQYNEMTSPYDRVPLQEKVSCLSNSSGKECERTVGLFPYLPSIVIFISRFQKHHVREGDSTRHKLSRRRQKIRQQERKNFAPSLCGGCLQDIWNTMDQP